uniref:Uncharacterized protein n=1 Tax=Lepeophtheirus salmonis TaxID=72036 RepID=A0A0K2TCX1_LEPSM
MQSIFVSTGTHASSGISTNYSDTFGVYMT